ncbi:hypothetical protein U1Q18_029133 [Sarracenia purpurea var. burkii]
MAGPLVAVASELMKESVAATGYQWEVHYSRFFNYPSLTSTNPSLVPLDDARRNRSKGTWISSSSTSTASINLAADRSSDSKFIITVTFFGKIHEEHYISKLHFSWPHVSCVSGFPARGSRVVFVSYKDCLGQASYELLLNILNILAYEITNGGNIGVSCDNLVSEISSQSEFVPSDDTVYRPKEDWNSMDSSTHQMQSSLNYEVAQSSNSQDTTLHRDIENIFTALPPSFASLVMGCHPVVEQGILS